MMMKRVTMTPTDNLHHNGLVALGSKWNLFVLVFSWWQFPNARPCDPEPKQRAKKQKWDCATRGDLWERTSGEKRVSQVYWLFRDTSLTVTFLKMNIKTKSYITLTRSPTHILVHISETPTGDQEEKKKEKKCLWIDKDEALHFGSCFGSRRTKLQELHLPSAWWFIFALFVVAASFQASLSANALAVRTLNYAFRVSCFFFPRSLFSAAAADDDLWFRNSVGNIS